MEPYQDNYITIYNKDSRSMDELPDESVQMVCTSPPYWGLRKYADLPDLVWGDNSCEHEWVIEGLVKSGGKEGGRASYHRRHDITVTTGFCSLCGAWKGQLGLEPTPELYLQHCIEILREIKRVLRKDGVVFWNIGDSYYGSGHGAWDNPSDAVKEVYVPRVGELPKKKSQTLKPKDLCLIPFRVAVAAQEDGWWVRSVIIWSKPNPMPESVTDRPTESHEYILMLTKSGTTQYWTHRDSGGTRQRPKADYRWVNQLTNEEVTIEPVGWKEKMPCFGCNGTGKETAVLWGDYEVEIGNCPECGGKGKVKLWRRINLWRGHDYYWDADAVREGLRGIPHSPGNKTITQPTEKGFRDPAYEPDRVWGDTGGRNIRTVWEFPTQPYPEAHFAVFPEKLPEICIKAATPEVGCCSKCGAPWERIVEKGTPILNAWSKKGAGNYDIKIGGWKETSIEEGSTLKHCVPHETLGWQPTCKCNADKVPSIVLDPFLGTGTTLWVAKKLGRRGVGYELSEAYCALSLERNRQSAMELNA